MAYAKAKHLFIEVGAVELLGRHVHRRPVVVGGGEVALGGILHPGDPEVCHLHSL